MPTDFFLGLRAEDPELGKVLQVYQEEIGTSGWTGLSDEEQDGL